MKINKTRPVPENPMRVRRAQLMKLGFTFWQADTIARRQHKLNGRDLSAAIDDYIASDAPLYPIITVANTLGFPCAAVARELRTRAAQGKIKKVAHPSAARYKIWVRS